MLDLPVNDTDEPIRYRTDAEREAEIERIPQRMQERSRRTIWSAADARRTVQVFMNVVDEARDMVTAAGAIGHVLTELLRHAEELLDVIDDEFSDLDRSQHVELFAAAPILRQKLERLRADLRGGASMRRLAWSELLDVMGDELLEVDRDQHGELSAAAPILRQKLSRLRDELRGRPCQLTGGPSRRLPITNRCRPVRFGAGLGIAARQGTRFQGTRGVCGNVQRMPRVPGWMRLRISASNSINERGATTDWC